MQSQLDFSPPAAPEQAGVRAGDLEKINQIFDRQLAEGLHFAAQLVVARDGLVLVDRAAGSFGGQQVRHDTPFYTFSVSKAFTGMCVHKLAEEGKLSLDAPVAEYWPEFARRGKGGITLRHIFHHTAGIHGFGRYRQIPQWPFWRLVTADVASMTPEHPPGEKMAYHAVNYGFILGEVVRRVSGMRFEEYFQRTFARPLGLEHTWFRIPGKALRRSPRVISGCAEQNTLARVFNLRPIRRAVIPAASLNSTAREMAIFYQMLVNQGSYAGKQFLKPETVRPAVTLGYRGWDEINQRETLWAQGFHLGGRDPSDSPTKDESTFGSRSTQATFGHMGNRSSMAWGDMDHKVVVTFTCDRLLNYETARQRWGELNNAVWDLLGI
ncbi:MAG TPA: serine hydrolase domain-containing protein [Desulfosarcina sp.]|nr:serine hydrolase domain-containing protein [Desulfosarcina sp.]